MRILGNTGMQRLFLMVFACFTFTNAAETDMEKFSFAHEVKVLVSDTEIIAGKVIRIKIRATGDKVTFPDIEEIDGVKVLEKYERVTNMFHYVNGVLKKERTTLVMTFAPHHDVTIPSYAIEIDGKVYHSKPVKIKVHPVSDANLENSNRFFLELKADKTSAIIGEPILVTVFFSLKLGLKLAEAPQYSEPEFKGFFSQEIGEEKVYREGTRQITELKYLLTPLSEGDFYVGPARAKLAVADRNKVDMFGRFVASTVPIASNRVKIHVAKNPKESDLVGHFSIESSVDKVDVKANRPVNLTVKITGDGILDDLVFPDYEMAGVTVYSDDAEVSTTLQGKQIKSSYVKRFAFISDHDFTIPSRTISAYDMESQTVKYLEIPAYDIKVEGRSAVAAGETKKENAGGGGQVQTNLKIPEEIRHDTEAFTLSVDEENREKLLLILAFVSGMIVMYLLRYLPGLKVKRHFGRYEETEALQILYPHISRSAEVEEMVHQLYAKKSGDKNMVIDKIKLKMLVKKYEL